MNQHLGPPVSWPRQPPVAPAPAEQFPRVDEVPLTTLGDMIAAVGRRWRPLLLWVLVCLAAGGWYLSVTPPEFSASATVILEPRRQSTAVQDGAAASYPPTLDSAQAESQIEVIRSERILASVFDLLDLRNAPECLDSGPGLRERLFAVVREKLLAALDLAPQPAAVDPAEAAVDSRTKAFRAFSDRVGVRRVGQSYVLEVSYRAGSATQAARIANAVTSAYILAQIDQKAAAAHNGAEYLQERISDIKTEQQAALDGIRQGQIPSILFPDADARIIGAALRPLGKSSPKTALVIAFALSAGLLSGLLMVAIGHALDRTLKTRAQVRHALGVECLGILPDAGRVRSARRAAALGRAVTGAPESRFAHAVRAARTSILLPFAGTGHHSVGLVSWLHGEGRTTLASNLAHLMAASGSPVKLIDGDLRRPTLTTQLAPRNDAGLNEALRGGTAGARLNTVQLSDALSFVPAVATGRTSEPNIHLGSQAMMELLAGLKVDRDVVVDLPPLGSSSDAQALCPLLDGVVLVVEAGRTTVEEALDALRVLRAANANVLGVVLNKARSSGAKPRTGVSARR